MFATYKNNFFYTYLSLNLVSTKVVRCFCVYSIDVIYLIDLDFFIIMVPDDVQQLGRNVVLRLLLSN